MGVAGFASGLAFGGIAVEAGAGELEVALLGGAGDVEDAVDPPVAPEVEAMPDGQTIAFARGERDRTGVPARELRLTREAERLTDLDEQRGGGDRPDPRFVAQGGAVGVEKVVEVAFELTDLAAGGGRRGLGR